MVNENKFNVKLCVAKRLPASVTFAVKVPLPVAVPLSTPAEDRVRPAGIVPVKLQVYGVAPPVAASVWE